jgi:hypothetical protein
VSFSLIRASPSGPEGSVHQIEAGQYTTWQQLSGYFDGDGNVGLEVVRYVLRFRLRFSDTWRPQIETVKSFLNERNIATTGVQHEKNEGRLDSYRIDVNSIEGALRAAKAMLPYCLKKNEDLRIMIDYMEGRLTGNQAIEKFNEEVRIGRRSGFMRDLSLPQTREEGLRMAQLENARNARAANAVKVDADVQNQIKKDHHQLKLSHYKLSKKYGYSASVIRRILGTK